MDNNIERYRLYLEQDDLWGINPQDMVRYIRLLCQEYHIKRDLDGGEYILIESKGLNFDYIIYEPNGNRNKVLIDYFYNALRVNQKNFFLTPYSKEQLKDMFLFKVKNLDAGFAIKETKDRHDSPTRDIVGVHNNSDVKRIGSKLILDAIKNDGKTLDHFDGFLSGLYSDLGFDGYHADEWDDQYTPTGWDFNPVDIRNKTYHSDKLDKYDINTYNKIKKRYDSGKPDIVYRKFKKS